MIVHAMTRQSLNIMLLAAMDGHLTRTERPALYRSVSGAGNHAVQYGNGVKAQAVYLSQYQRILSQRVQERIHDQLPLTISAGCVFAFNQRYWRQSNS
jgi:hypothetical protein